MGTTKCPAGLLPVAHADVRIALGLRIIVPLSNRVSDGLAVHYVLPGAGALDCQAPKLELDQRGFFPSQCGSQRRFPAGNPRGSSFSRIPMAMIKSLHFKFEIRNPKLEIRVMNDEISDLELHSDFELRASDFLTSTVTISPAVPASIAPSCLKPIAS